MHRIAGMVAALMAMAALAGLVVPGNYRDNPLVTAGWRGTDAVTLALAVPLLFTALRRSLRGMLRWRMVMLGMLLYALYNYLFYLFGAAFNALFLVYVAIVTLSAFGLATGLATVDVERAAAGIRAGSPVRVIAIYMAAVGLLLGGFWTVTSLTFLFTGEPPAMVQATAHPTNVTGALDLSIVVTLALLAAHRLWRGHAWGYVLAVLWNVKGAVYMLALGSATVWAYLTGELNDLAQLALWIPIGVGCLLASIALLRGYRESARELHGGNPVAGSRAAL